jgi:DNA-binding NarL/FixJ family response regulator
MKQGHVLLADQHQNVLAGLRTLLEATFETVVMVADEASLLEAAERLEPDLAIIDISLPVSTEENVARRLGNRHPRLKFIVLSVHDEPTAVNEALAAGASGFVLKRSAATDLIPAVREVLQGGIYTSPSLRSR